LILSKTATGYFIVLYSMFEYKYLFIENVSKQKAIQVERNMDWIGLASL
jgi:hypothetical protein